MKQSYNYNALKVKQVVGRYVTNSALFPFLDSLSNQFKVDVIGSSVLGKEIKSVQVGHGPHKILMWSQMHGNEATTTKAVLDLLNAIMLNDEMAKTILSTCTLLIIPILNPDGAEAYTRFNANQIDLNRDAKDLSQPESKVLREQYNAFKPHYCFNLHDQRTIYNVGVSEKSATVSFLAPSVNEERSINEPRMVAMQLIDAMNKTLQTKINGQVGRYDDGYNINCVGDMFQTLGTPTILFEAGHFPGDYIREQTREFIFDALCTAITVIGEQSIANYTVKEYQAIPENGKQFVDVIVKNAQLLTVNGLKTDVVIHFEEKLQGGKVDFVPYCPDEIHPNVMAHQYYNCENEADLQVIKLKPRLLNLVINR